MKFSNAIPNVRAHRGQVFIEFMCDHGEGQECVARVALTRHSAHALQHSLYGALADLHSAEASVCLMKEEEEGL